MRKDQIATAVVLLPLALAPTGCQLLKSDEWRDDGTAATDEPPAAAPAEPGFTVELPSWPLLVDDRLRIVARQSEPGDRVNELIAQPLTAAADAPPHWSYRREVSSVNALALLRPAEGNPVVAALWSDARLVGLDAFIGEVRWRSEAVLSGEVPLSFPFDPAEVTSQEVVKAVPTASGDVLVVQVDQQLIGVDAGTGEQRWQVDQPGCEDAYDTDPLSWWPVGGSIVVDATCGLVRFRVFDPLTGAETDQYETALEGGFVSGVQVFGCHTGSPGCEVIEHYPAEAWRGDPEWYTVRDGQLAPVDGSTRGEPEYDVWGGGSQLHGVDVHTGKQVWEITGETHDLSEAQFFDVAVGDGAVWVASHAWNGGGPALVQLDPADGTVVGCQEPPPIGRPTRIGVEPGGLLVVTDRPLDSLTAWDPDDPDGTVVMLAPQPEPPEPREHGLPDCRV
ncbi:MAG TPA: PQQ-binding-like beta-propeller repeat protein [Natronosporangium sp.]